MVKAAGEVHDPERDAYFEGYIAALASLIDEDISLKGYFPWSLLDKYGMGLRIQQAFRDRACGLRQHGPYAKAKLA